MRKFNYIIRCIQCNCRLKSRHLPKHLKDKCVKTKALRKQSKPKRLKFTSETYKKEYLTSEHWQEIRGRFYSKWKWCRLCGNKKNLNIHHITYKRIGYEKDTDLIVVCEDCHINRIHQDKISKKQLFDISHQIA